MTELVWDGKYGAGGARSAPVRTALPFQTVEIAGASGRHDHEETWRNRLIWGDKRYVLPSLLPEFAGKIDLVYIDPPFDTGGDFSVARRIPGSGASSLGTPGTVQQTAYRDTWGRGLDGYLQWFYETVLLLHELLTETGSIYVHLDWRLDQYARCIMDEVFGSGCFRNAIAWRRDVAGKGAKRASRQWPRNADTILCYSRSATAWTFNQPFSALSELQKKAYKYVDAAGRRYKAVQLGDYSAASIARLQAQGLIHTSKSTGARYKKYYLDEARATVDAIWTDIPGFGTRTAAAEQVDYPTQKPEALLERIIAASSNAGDLVLDCFCGSGTTAVVAERLGRRWLAADLGRCAILTTHKRLLSRGNAHPFVVQTLGTYERQAWQAALSLDVGRNGHAVTVALRDFIMPPDDVPSNVQAAITHWSQWIDYWAIDWDFKEDTFHNQWQSYRTRKDPTLQCQVAHTYDAPGTYTIMVKVVDILGNGTTSSAIVDVP